LIAIKSEGVGETQDKLEGVEQSMDETAESAGDSAEQLEGFSQRFAGAMGAAVAALAVGAAGLLSQVPVLGEAFSGLSAIVQAVALKMDKTLRPAISGVTDTLFEIANGINDSEGGLGGLIGKFGVLASIAGLVVGALMALGVTITGPILLAIGLIAAAIGALWTAWENNFANIRGVVQDTISNITDRFNSFIQTVEPAINRFLTWLSNAWDKHGGKVKDTVNFVFRAIGAAIESVLDGILTALEVVIQLLDGDFKGAWQSIKDFIGRMVDQWGPLVSEAVGAVKDILIGLAEGLVNWAGNLADDAYNWGISVIEGFIQGIRETLNDAGDFLGDVASTVGIDIPDVSGSIGVDGAFGGGAGAALANTAAGAFARRGRSGDGGTTLDGRQLTESTGRYRSDPARRQGL